MPSPYTNRSMLHGDSPMFYGRERELGVISDSLATNPPQSCAVVGDRRIGKSSLLHRIFWQIRHPQGDEEARWKNARVLYLNAQILGGATQAKFFSRLMTEFQKQIDPTQPEENGPTPIDYERFERFIRTHSQDHKFVVFLDEFEEFAGEGEFDDAFFDGLRGLCDDPDCKLAFVTASQNGLEALCHQQKIETSNFWNIFTTTKLGLLDERDAELLRTEPFERAGIDPRTLHQNVIRELSGDHPFFIQLVCDHFHRNAGIFNEVQRVALRTEARPFLEDIWRNRSLEEQIAIHVFMALEGKVPRYSGWWLETLWLKLKGTLKPLPKGLP